MGAGGQGQSHQRVSLSFPGLVGGGGWVLFALSFAVAVAFGAAVESLRVRVQVVEPHHRAQHSERTQHTHTIIHSYNDVFKFIGYSYNGRYAFLFIHHHALMHLCTYEQNVMDTFLLFDSFYYIAHYRTRTCDSEFEGSGFGCKA